MKKEDLKYLIKNIRRNQKLLLIGLLSGVLLSLFLIMLILAFSKVRFCRFQRCDDQYQTSQVTASAEVAVDEDAKAEPTPTQIFESQPTIEDQELEIVIDPKEDPVSISGQQYQIEKGDCLWDIAERTLGSGYRWVEIYQLNKDVIGSNPDLIYPDVVLNLPQR